MRPPATTAEILEYQALREPRLPAFREEDSELDYGQFYGMVAQAGLWLQRLGVKRGDRVAVSGPGYGIQLVLLVAAEGLGASTASFNGEADNDAPFLFALVQWVFSARPQQVPAGVRFQLLDEAVALQLAQPLDGQRPAWDACELHEPQRISRTSGSTGASKFMVLRRQAQEHWIRAGLDVAGFGASPRMLVLGPLVINAGFTRSSACLRHGGALLVGSGRDIARLAPSYVWGLPLQVERLLEELPPGWRAPQPVPVATFGGSVSEPLRGRIAAVFGGRIANRYGSNETSAIVDDLDADSSGVLAPGTEVRILDPQGREVAPGVDGIIAVRTPALADGYLGRPEETAAAFRDGWFITGDVGALVGRRRLHLSGRHDELVNIGGIKVPAQRLEAELRRQPAIADCAALAVQAEGVTLGLVLVAAPGASEDEARLQAQQALQLPHPAQTRVVFVAALPRLPAGKVDRMALLRMFM